MRSLLLLAPLLATSAFASERLTGDVLDIHYNDYGTWNESTTGVGLLFLSSAGWVEFTYPGTPYQRWTAEWTQDSVAYFHYADSSGYDTTASAVAESDDSTASDAIATHSYTMDSLTIVKTESWDLTDSTMLVEFMVTNNGTTDVTDFRLFYEFDADQEYNAYSVFDTYNDVSDASGDGTPDWASSVGSNTGLAIGIGACDVDAATLGHYSGWGGTPDADTTISDSDDAYDDTAMGLRHTEPRTIPAGGTVLTSMLVAVAETEADAEADYLANMALCVGCDVDGDGSDQSLCGGDDCDDAEATTYPGAADTWYDGVDSDCAGNSDYDQDADGQDAASYGGTDCNDLDATVYLGAPDAWYDGTDSDCAGNSDYDQDADGDDSASYGGTDCNDLDATVYLGAPDAWYDGTDSDCAGNSDYDQDADGDDSADHGGGDCDDLDATTHSGAAETWYDDLDSDCSGGSDFDQDGDGDDAAEYGGDDCDDLDDTVHPGATDAWYDGIDSDCDGESDYDQDGDGDDSADHGGGDCDDLDATVSSIATEIWYDGFDTDCSGGSDFDQDGDGVDDPSGNGTDCDDTDATVATAEECNPDPGGDPDGEDSGEADTGKQDIYAGGCGCDTTPGAGAAVGAMLGGLVLAARRRRT